MRIERAAELVKLWQWVKLSYTRYYKRKYGFVGHLFQGRFRSLLIPEESYYLQCGRYIERNPVSAGMTKRAEDYLHSSARFYVRGMPSQLITPNLYYQEMGATIPERREAYRKFLLTEDPYRAMVDEVLNRA